MKQNHIPTVPRCTCLAATCHLHVWQNEGDILRATAVTRGWNKYQNKSRHRKHTPNIAWKDVVNQCLEFAQKVDPGKKILPPLHTQDTCTVPLRGNQKRACILFQESLVLFCWWWSRLQSSSYDVTPRLVPVVSYALLPVPVSSNRNTQGLSLTYQTQ